MSPAIAGAGVLAGVAAISSSRNRGRRFRVDRGAVEFGSALVPHTYPTAAFAQLGSRGQKISRQFVSGFGGPGRILECHPAGIEHNVAIVEQVEIEKRHDLGTTRNGHGASDTGQS
jgi:hypothetical protein